MPAMAVVSFGTSPGSDARRRMGHWEQSRDSRLMYCRASFVECRHPNKLACSTWLRSRLRSRHGATLKSADARTGAAVEGGPAVRSARRYAMSNVHNKMPKLLICFVGMTLASAAVAQAPRSSVDIAATTGAPEFRDPKTGQVWTPETVGQDGRPLTGPDDKAFDPQAQSVPRQGRRTARARQARRHRAGHGRTDRADRRHGQPPRCGRCPASAGRPCCISTTTAATRSTPSSSAASPMAATPSWTRAPSSRRRRPAYARVSRSMARERTSSSTACRAA